MCTSFLYDAESLTKYGCGLDAVRLFIYFEHYNYILLCDSVPGRYYVSLRTCAGHNTFEFHLTLAKVEL